MKVSDFDYELPPERIAQQPLAQRDASRLLLLGRTDGAISHRRFAELPGLLRSGDLLVFNDTRVLPARLRARKDSGGRVELLLVERLDSDATGSTWSCWLRASRAPAIGTALSVDGGARIDVLERRGEQWTVRLPAAEGGVEALLRRVGRAPLPPYIRRDEEGTTTDDRERYQTVFARHAGAVAAPTAGLHFTESMLGTLRGRGVELAYLTLHVGPGTFQPVRVDQVEGHRLHEERFVLPPATAAAVQRARSRGGRIVAVGTTVVRTLESRARPHGGVTAGEGRCGTFIYPGFRFRVVDAMITNFHLPRSTLLMLVAAFAGLERVLAAYRQAVDCGYRFYSYGDAMFIGPH